MSIPATTTQLIALLVFVLPGIVYAAVRGSLRGLGTHDRSVGTRVLHAIVVGAVLNAVYLLALGNWPVPLSGTVEDVVRTPRTLALLVLLLGVVVPATVAYFLHGAALWRRPKRTMPKLLRWLRIPQLRRNFEPTPTAWDKYAPNRGGCWMRVRIADGQWVGGWFASNSFVSTYPEPRDVFIEEQHHVDEFGEIGEIVPNSAGVWLALKEGDIVEWIRGTNEDGDDTQEQQYVQERSERPNSWRDSPGEGVGTG